MEVRGYPLPQGGMVHHLHRCDASTPTRTGPARATAELEQRVEARTSELREREAQLARKAALLEVVINNVNQGISFCECPPGAGAVQPEVSGAAGLPARSGSARRQV